MDGSNFMHIHNDTILNNAANTECCIKKQKLNFRMKYIFRLLPFSFFIILPSCISTVDIFPSNGVGYSSIWNIENYPPRVVIQDAKNIKKHKIKIKNFPLKCGNFKEFLAFKLLSFDEFGNSYSSSAVSVNLNNENLFITNKHSVHGRHGFFLIDSRGNYSEAKLKFKHSNIFNNYKNEDIIDENIAIDLAVLTPIGKNQLNFVSKPLYEKSNFSGKVISMGFPGGNPLISIAYAYSNPNYLVIYDENPFYSIEGSSGGGVYDCITGKLVGLTFSTPSIPQGINPKTGEKVKIYGKEQLKHFSLIAHYSIHSEIIKNTISTMNQ